MFSTQGVKFVCVSVCPSVTAFMARWLDLATQYQVMVLLFARTQECNINNCDPLAEPDHTDLQYKITCWPIKSKGMNRFTSIFNNIYFNSGDII